MFISLWNGDYDLYRHLSQLVPTEVKTGPTYVKQSIMIEEEKEKEKEKKKIIATEIVACKLESRSL